MKTPFFTVSAIMFLVSSVAGQSPSAAAKDSLAESGGLTKDERTRAVEYLTQTHKEFLAAVEGVSDAQWKWKAAPEKWSIAENS